jgi:hypothetical protein
MDTKDQVDIIKSVKKTIRNKNDCSYIAYAERGEEERQALEFVCKKSEKDGGVRQLIVNVQVLVLFES